MMSQQVKLTLGGPFSLRGFGEGHEQLGRGCPWTSQVGGLGSRERGALASSCTVLVPDFPGLSGERIPQGLGPSSSSLKLIYAEWITEKHLGIQGVRLEIHPTWPLIFWARQRLSLNTSALTMAHKHQHLEADSGIQSTLERGSW